MCCGIKDKKKNMNWSNYLSDKKCPSPPYAHLGVLEGEVWGYWDLSQVPKGTKILSLPTPLKRTKLSYSNWNALRNNDEIEAIKLGDIDEERIDVLSSLPNLKYLEISCNKQDEFPELSTLKSLQILILANIKRVDNIEFLKGLSDLKTLYICDLNHLYDLSPIAELRSLQELFLSNGGMCGVGKPVKSMEPLSRLLELEYLHFCVTVENRNYDISSLFPLKKLKHLSILPRFLKKGNEEKLKEMLPLLNW